MIKDMNRPHCTVKFTKSRLGPSAVLYDAEGRSINAINFPKGEKLNKSKKDRARKLLLQNSPCASWSLGDIFGPKPVPKWLAGALALAGGLFVFNAVKTADPNAS